MSDRQRCAPSTGAPSRAGHQPDANACATHYPRSTSFRSSDLNSAAGRPAWCVGRLTTGRAPRAWPTTSGSHGCVGLPHTPAGSSHDAPSSGCGAGKRRCACAVRVGVRMVGRRLYYPHLSPTYPCTNTVTDATPPDFACSHAHRRFDAVRPPDILLRPPSYRACGSRRCLQ
jgi:hypothetical protein